MGSGPINAYRMLMIYGNLRIGLVNDRVVSIRIAHDGS